MLEKLKEIFIESTGITDIEITLETNLKNDLGLNSFDLAQLVCTIEDEFDIEISDDAIRNIKTVDDVIKYIKNNEMV